MKLRLRRILTASIALLFVLAQRMQWTSRAFVANRRPQSLAKTAATTNRTNRYQRQPEQRQLFEHQLHKFFARETSRRSEKSESTGSCSLRVQRLGQARRFVQRDCNFPNKLRCRSGSLQQLDGQFLVPTIGACNGCGAHLSSLTQLRNQRIFPHS